MNKDVPETIREKLPLLPRRPGVYLLKDRQSRIIYVGKAQDLLQRVRSYFQARENLPPKVRAMAERVSDLDYTVTDTEMEALILENNLIKEHQPHYNINLRDDKQYPYLRITVQEPFPRLHLTRRMEPDGARYFGPYTDAGALRETIRLLRRFFPFRHCQGEFLPGQRRPCLNRHIRRCLAPCAGEVNESEYRTMVEEALLFLEGKRNRLLKDLSARMRAAAEQLDFEQAARLRDQCRALEMVLAGQKLADNSGGDHDCLALAAASQAAVVQLFSVRGGKLTGREHFYLTNPTEEGEPQLLAAFLRWYYSRAGFVPREIFLSTEVPEQPLLAAWLKELRGGRVTLRVPKRGARKEMLRLAAENAGLFLQQEMLREEARNPQKALQDLAGVLGLKEVPGRIEGYDISHLHGEGTVAAMVVFAGGLPLGAAYRRFRIGTVEGPDDYAALGEALRRRLSRLTNAGRDETPKAADDPFRHTPDLVLVDGGAGQLSSVLQACTQAGFPDLPVVSLAKEAELVFLPGVREPLALPRSSPALQLLQRIRDEAHRFAVTYQRTLRGGKARRSRLLEVPGIGEKRKTALLVHFGSMAALKKATPEQLAAAARLDRATAGRLYCFLQEND
jgi:excinuclease ABC subunit C